MPNPIVVKGNGLTIREQDMEYGKLYRFEYLGFKMVAIRSPVRVDLYQELGQVET